MNKEIVYLFFSTLKDGSPSGRLKKIRVDAHPHGHNRKHVSVGFSDTLDSIADQLSNTLGRVSYRINSPLSLTQWDLSSSDFDKFVLGFLNL